MTSPTAPGVTHRWTNLRAYADEVSQARIWAGFHYRFSTRVGQDMGRKIGQYVVNNVMQASHRRGRALIGVSAGLNSSRSSASPGSPPGRE